MSQTLSGWLLIEYQAILLGDEGSLQNYCSAEQRTMFSGDRLMGTSKNCRLSPFMRVWLMTTRFAEVGRWGSSDSLMRIIG